MTVIVGVANSSGHWIAGDRSTSDGKYMEPMSEPKVYERGQYLFGYAGNIGIGQNVAWNFEFPGTSSYEEMFTVFQPALNEFVDSLGIDRANVVGDEGSVFLISGHEHIWVYNVQDGQLVPYKETAIGSGGAVALGSLKTSVVWSASARRVTVAAKVACEIVISCMEPVDVLFSEANV
jgi:20S proteasome alpha/beta subunit